MAKTTFHLGDFAMGGSAEWCRLLERLNGRIYLILGNHDMKTIGKGFSRFEQVAMQMLINVGDQRIYLNHYPFLCFGGAYRNTWQLFGHVHTNNAQTGLDYSRLNNLFPSQYDVGVGIIRASRKNNQKTNKRQTIMRISKDENPEFFQKLFGDIDRYEQWAPYFYPEFVAKYTRMKGVVAGVMTPSLVNVNDLLDDEFEIWLESKDIFLHDVYPARTAEYINKFVLANYEEYQPYSDVPAKKRVKPTEEQAKEYWKCVKTLQCYYERILKERGEIRRDGPRYARHHLRRKW